MTTTRRILLLVTAATLALTGSGVVHPPPAAAVSYRITGMVGAAGHAGPDHRPVKRVTVACPLGKVIVGGGATAYEVVGDEWRWSRYLTITQLEPGLLIDGRYTWTGAMEESGAGVSNPWVLRVTAECADRPPQYALRQEMAPVSDEPSKTAAATCPTGTKVIGGGAAVRSLAEKRRVSLTMSRVDALGVLMRTQAHAAPRGTTEPWGLLATAVCADQRIEGYEIRNALSSGEDEEDKWSQPMQSAVAECSLGREPLSAGGAVSDDLGGYAGLGTVATYGLAIGHEPYPNNENWGFVLARLICADVGW